MSMVVNRRDILAKSAYVAIASGLAIAVRGLAQEQNGEPAFLGTPEFLPVNGVISTNHGHVAQLTAEQIESKDPISLSIQGESGHSHSLDISPEDLKLLRQGNAIQLVSSNDFGHSHKIVFTPSFGIKGSISDNHGHEAFLSPEIFSVVISVQGNSGHQHSIRLTAEDLIKISKGEPLSVSYIIPAPRLEHFFELI